MRKTSHDSQLELLVQTQRLVVGSQLVRQQRQCQLSGPAACETPLETRRRMAAQIEPQRQGAQACACVDCDQRPAHQAATAIDAIGMRESSQ
jgi:hypothetical protein